MIQHVEVLIIGAGPAGATAGLNIAPFRRVMLVDLVTEPVRKIGECLLPAVGRLISDMGLWERFREIEPLPWYANRSIWGSAIASESDFLSDPGGHGWHIDRARFDDFLRKSAVHRGAVVVAPARLLSLSWEGTRFVAKLQSRFGDFLVYADFLIDAGGRSSPAAVRLGAKRNADAPLFCSSMYGRDRNPRAGAGITFIEAVENGWWYTAPVPGNLRVLAFHTDSDVHAARRIRSSQRLLRESEGTLELLRVLKDTGFEAEERCYEHGARGSLLNPCGGPGWLAAGDAALSFDPLSSQGLFTAMFLGLAAAEAAHSYLEGDHSAVRDYANTIGRIRDAYCRGLRETYRQEQRWPASWFWRRRHAAAAQRKPVAAHLRANAVTPGSPNLHVGSLGLASKVFAVEQG